MDKIRVSEILSKFRNKRIAVIGDLMLDSYVWGKVTRISPEAPVPVVLVKKRTYSLGGAANVMCNIAALGGDTVAFGIIGQKDNGNFLLKLMKEKGINTENIISDKNYLTIEKQRIIADSQQLARVDYEIQENISAVLQENTVNKVNSLLKDRKLDAVIFEDYAKGLLTGEMINSVIKTADELGVPVALDPHPSHKMDVKGLTLMTPNQNEAFTLAGVYPTELKVPVYKDNELLKVAEKLNNEWDVKQLLITLGYHGMVLFEQNEAPVHIPTKAKEVFDVTGAGDSVIANYIMSILGGASGPEAADISNQAAGIVVGRIGTSFVTPEELLGLYE